MKRIILVMMVILLSSSVAQATDISIGTDVASAYVFRGFTVNDGLVIQPYAIASGFPIPEKYGSFTVGSWANYDIGDYGGTLDNNKFSEVDLFIYYALPVNLLDVIVGYTECIYPDSDVTNDRELNLSLSKGIGETGITPYFKAYHGVYGTLDGISYLQGGVGYKLPVTNTLSFAADAGAGYTAGGTERGFNDVTGSFTATYALTAKLNLKASIVYLAELDALDADTQCYGNIGISYNFSRKPLKFGRYLSDSLRRLR